MGMLFNERIQLVMWLLAAVVGVALAFGLGIIQYHSVGVTFDHRSFGWSKVGFASNGELATIGLIAAAYFAIRTIASVMGVRNAFR